MSKVGVAAATRDYLVKPRLEYRTLQGVNGPLVILEVRFYARSRKYAAHLCLHRARLARAAERVGTALIDAAVIHLIPPPSRVAECA